MNDLKNLSTDELKELWLKYFKTSLPKLKKPMLIKYIHWYQQAKEYEVNLRAFYSTIEKASKDYSTEKVIKNDIAYERGTKFIRSYKGEKYEVEVIKEGFLYKGEIYKSLSAIARKITGVHWNGKTFFRGEHGRKEKNN
ncbi:MAG: DUF2924 domain-containing protein [Endomicrobia bacterium]|nr:DUF2924 domain-containing protein [Endomicrobiia bacterium]